MRPVPIAIVAALLIVPVTGADPTMDAPSGCDFFHEDCLGSSGDGEPKQDDCSTGADGAGSDASAATVALPLLGCLISLSSTSDVDKFALSFASSAYVGFAIESVDAFYCGATLTLSESTCSNSELYPPTITVGHVQPGAVMTAYTSPEVGEAGTYRIHADTLPDTCGDYEWNQQNQHYYGGHWEGSWRYPLERDSSFGCIGILKSDYYGREAVVHFKIDAQPVQIVDVAFTGWGSYLRDNVTACLWIGEGPRTCATAASASWARLSITDPDLVEPVYLSFDAAYRWDDTEVSYYASVRVT